MRFYFWGMQKKRIHNKPELKQFRRALRNNSTSAEAVLWTYLKEKQLEGRKFRRQYSIGNYIVDFYCPCEQLVIELDGENHFWEDGLQHDINRTNYLYTIGIRVIRFENKWIFEDIEFVLREISNQFLITS